MTDNERLESILKELKLDFISYDNLHGDNEHGCRVIESALKKQVPTKPKEQNGYHFCNSCGFVSEFMGLRFSFCPRCGQNLDWSEVE